MAAKKQKKKKQVRNKARDMIGDYYKSNQMTREENRRRQEQEEKPKGLKNLNVNEKIYIVVIVLGLIGIFVKYVILR